MDITNLSKIMTSHLDLTALCDGKSYIIHFKNDERYTVGVWDASCRGFTTSRGIIYSYDDVDGIVSVEKYIEYHESLKSVVKDNIYKIFDKADWGTGVAVFSICVLVIFACMFLGTGVALLCGAKVLTWFILSIVGAAISAFAVGLFADEL